VSEFDQDPVAEEGVRVTDKRRIDPDTGEVPTRRKPSRSRRRLIRRSRS